MNGMMIQYVSFGVLSILLVGFCQFTLERPAHAQEVPVEVMMVAEQANVRDKTPECLKPLVNAELSFIKRVCNPSTEQMQSIVAEAKSAFDSMSDLSVEGQRFIGNGRGDFQGPNQEVFSGNPYTRVRSDAARYLTPLVSEDQYQRYVAEAKARDAFERSAAIDIALELIDDLVLLTSNQRVSIHEKLMQEWKDVDFQMMKLYLSNPQYMPEIPLQAFRKILDKAQLKLLTDGSVQRVFFTVTLQNNEHASLGEDWIQ